MVHADRLLDDRKLRHERMIRRGILRAADLDGDSMLDLVLGYGASRTESRFSAASATVRSPPPISFAREAW
jgi:hypothetical protein